VTRLAREVPEPPASLGEADAADLSKRARAALAGQRRELETSLDAALGYIPFPLRVAVRRVLGL
jgi:hypothetical protein